MGTMTDFQGLVGNMRDRAQGIEDEEKKRYESGVGTATKAFEQSQQALGQLVDPDLLFSKAADSIGVRSRRSLQGLRGSLGARGLNPNSGAAQGLLSRMAFQTEGSLTGARRDIALENQKQRQVNAAVNFANALNLAGLVNAPVSGAGLETEQNIFEGRLAMYGINSMAASMKSAGKTGVLGSLIGGGASIGGRVLGGLI